MSRRVFLGLSGAGLAAGTIAPALGDDGFSIGRTGRIVHVSIGKLVRWSIDPGNFGPDARADFSRDGERIEIELTNARFAGTTLPADFRCTVMRSAGLWGMALRSASGMSLEANWIEWLQGRQPATGWWRPGILNPIPEFALNVPGSVLINFSPDWVLAAQGPGHASVGKLAQKIEISRWTLALNHPERIAGTSDGKSTTFFLKRGDLAWPVDVTRDSADGWTIGHDSAISLFDEMRVEAVDEASGPIYSGLLTQANGNEKTLRFFPGGGLFSGSGELFHLALEAPRLAFSLTPDGPQSALVAELSTEPVWAHTDALSVMFSGSEENSRFELVDDGNSQQPSVTPVATAIQCPGDQDCTIRLKFDKPRHTPLTWGKILDPLERVLGVLGLARWEHQMAFDLSCGDVLTVVRPTDMLKLDFEFQGVRLVAGWSPKIHVAPHKGQPIDPAKAPAVGETTIEPMNGPCGGACLPAADGSSTNCARLHCQPNGMPQVTVTFPPQHINEQAFFHSDGEQFNVHTNDFKLGDAEVADLKQRTQNAALTPAAALHLVDPNLGVPPPANVAPDSAPAAAANAVMAGESKLVFQLNLDDHGIPFLLEQLLDWSKWTPLVHDVANTTKASQKPHLPAKLSDLNAVTTIELPYRLFLSPSEKGQWAHSPTAVGAKKSTAVELWHTRLGVTNSTGKPDENNQADRTARAIYTPDLDPVANHWVDHQGPVPGPADPRFSLDARDRQELVHLTSNFNITAVPYTPTPTQLDHLMLTSLGGYLKSLGRWEPPFIDANHVLSVEQWKHIATLGRDQYVRVVYKGYLAPFAHRASLIKVTERKIVPYNGSYYAFLHQRMYIVIETPRRDFPLFGQPKGGRNFPFQRIDALTLVTPDLDQPSPNQSLFWPSVGGVFLFRFRFWDMDNNISEASLPVLFGDAEQSQTLPHCTDMVNMYNRGSGSGTSDDPWTCISFNNQSIAFAPTQKPGDTRYDANRLCWQVVMQNLGADTAYQVYTHNLPLFYPVLSRAKVASASIKRITGDATPVWVKFFQSYIDSGFDPKANRGEVIFQVDDTTLPALRFGAAGKTDQAGGLSSPDTLVVGFSRKSGAVGGTASPKAGGVSLSTWSQGTFNPADFFGGFTSAKLLGAVKLADIIMPLLGGLDSNLDKAPRMVEQELFDLAGDAEAAAISLEDQAVKLIRALQSDVSGNPLPQHLAAQAQTVYAAQAARDVQAAASPNDPLSLAVAHASLIQAIAAYGAALNSLLQDPSSLLAESAVSLLQALMVDSSFMGFLNSVQQQAAALVAQVQGAVLAALTAVQNKFFAPLQDLQNKLVTAIDPLAALVIVKGQQFQRTQMELRKLAPEIFALLDLVPVVQDLVANVNGIKSAAIQVNLPGVADRLGAIGKDLLQLQQGLGVLGIAVPVPAVVQKAKDIQRNLIGAWDIGNRDLRAARDALHAACTVLAAQKIPANPGPNDFNNAAATQVLQNLRQIERSLDHLDQLRKQYPELAGFLSNPQLNPLPDDKAHRWLQRLQQLQRQVVESANALQKVATDFLQSADGPLVDAAANLLVLLVAPAGHTSLIEILTAFSNLALAADSAAGHPIEILVQPLFVASQDLQSSLSVQIGEIRSQLAAARAQLSGLSPQAQADLTALLSAVQTASARDINTAASPALKQAAHDAVVATARTLVTHAVLNELVPLAAARMQVWDLATRYQNCVASIVSWTLYFTGRVDATEMQALATATKALQVLLIPALRAISTAGASLNQYVTNPNHSPLDVLLAGSCSPLATLPSPSNGTGIAELFQDVQITMAAVKTAISDIQDRGRDIAADVKSLANVKSLVALIATLPIPTKISFSFDWKPEIKSFEPVFLLDPGAEFVISAKFEVDALSPAQPTYDISASLSHFSINLIGSPSFVIIKVTKLIFTSTNGNKPDCRLTIDSIGFGSDLSFVQQLATLLNPQNGPFIEFAGGGVRAGFRFHVPDLTMGAFSLMQLAIEVAIQLSFNGDPVRCELGISDQTHPFLLSTGIFGGGGFFQLQLGLDGVKLLQGALEFGIVAAISIGPLEGSGYVVAGIYMCIAGNDSKVSGFVHAHGHMDIFGLISMDVDLYVAVTYDNGSVSGTAEFTVSVHILFFSASFTLQASYGYQGSDNQGGGDGGDADALLPAGPPSIAAEQAALDYDMNQEEWAEYHAAFAA